MSLFTRHPAVLQSAYSDLRRRGLEQPFLLAGTPGSVGVRHVNGHPFYYRQFYDAEGRKAAEYIGPTSTPQAEGRAKAVRDEIALTNVLIKDARVLWRHGYLRADARTGAILASLANHDLFRAGAVLVGSHAYAVLLNELGIDGGTFFTEGVDVARGRPLAISPGDDETFARMLTDSMVPCAPVLGADRKRPVTSFKTTGADSLSVDLLAPTQGREIDVRAVPELRAHATALPYLEHLLDGPRDAVVLGREAIIPVKVPRPEAFVWNKVVVSELRTGAAEKRRKDISQAAVLFAVLSEEAPDALRAAFEALPRAARAKTRAAKPHVVAALERASQTKALETMHAFL
jgi:hypothetical protein